MNIISTRAHGVLDYIVGVALILAPRIFGFADGGAAQRVPEILGIATIVYSLLTRYELGLIKVLPFRAHLTIDLVSGIFLALSPWLLGFADQVLAPHLIVGLLEIGAVLMTRKDPAITTSMHSPPGSPAHS